MRYSRNVEMNRKKGIDMSLQNDDKLFDEKQLATEWWEKHRAFAIALKRLNLELIRNSPTERVNVQYLEEMLKQNKLETNCSVDVLFSVWQTI